MLRRFALFGLLCSTGLAWSIACSSGDNTKTSGDNAAGAAGENGSGVGGANSAGAGNGGYGSNISAGTGSTSSGSGSTTGAAGAGSTWGGASCDAPDGSGPSECSNGVDDDGDGQIDGFDVECTGACDDDESSFATGIPGDNKDPHQDCFFDGDSGAGNDGCRDQENPSDECIAFCKALTSNGCDCFGCCTVTLENGDTTSVQLGGECNDFETDVGTDKCQECTPAEECMNTCGHCELCPGKTELPADCNTGSGGGSGTGGGGSGIECDNGATACDASADCGATGYCQLGCCVEIIFK